MILTDGKNDREVTNIKLTDDNILVGVCEDKEVTQSGIWIGRDDFGRFLKGIVYGFGPKVVAAHGELFDREIRYGSEILFSKNRGVEYKIDGRAVLIIKEEDVWAVIED